METGRRGDGETGRKGKDSPRLPVSPSSFLHAVAQISVLPQPDAAAHSERVGNDLDIGAETGRDVLGVAAADVELVEIGQRAEYFHGLCQALVPFAPADFFEGAIAQLLLV